MKIVDLLGGQAEYYLKTVHVLRAMTNNLSIFRDRI